MIIQANDVAHVICQIPGLNNIRSHWISFYVAVALVLHILDTSPVEIVIRVGDSGVSLDSCSLLLSGARAAVPPDQVLPHVGDSLHFLILFYYLQVFLNSCF